MSTLNSIEVLPPLAAVPADLSYDDWLSQLRDLAHQRRNVDWMIGDCLRVGLERFPEQVEMALLGGELGIAPKRLKLAVEVSGKFPAHARDETLSIEHHAHVANLPRAEQMELLGQAKREHWSDDDLRKQTISHKVHHGHAQMLSADEYDDHCRMALQHAWNRASANVRSDFLEMATDAKGGVIDG